MDFCKEEADSMKRNEEPEKKSEEPDENKKLHSAIGPNRRTSHLSVIEISHSTSPVRSKFSSCSKFEVAIGSVPRIRKTPPQPAHPEMEKRLRMTKRPYFYSPMPSPVPAHSREIPTVELFYEEDPSYDSSEVLDLSLRSPETRIKIEVSPVNDVPCTSDDASVQIRRDVTSEIVLRQNRTVNDEISIIEQSDNRISVEEPEDFIGKTSKKQSGEKDPKKFDEKNTKKEEHRKVTRKRRINVGEENEEVRLHAVKRRKQSQHDTVRKSELEKTLKKKITKARQVMVKRRELTEPVGNCK